MKNKTVVRVIIALLVCAVLALAGILLWRSSSSESDEIEESSGVSGIISEDWDSGIDHGSVQSSDVQIPGYKEAKMSAGDDILHLNIGNPKENSVGFEVTVELEDGTVLYQSPILEPGQGISELPLLTSPEKGTYQAYVVYQIVSLDEEHAPMNTAKSAFTLYVE